MPMSPAVVADPPPGWQPAEITPPKIAESAGAELTGWRAASGGRGAALVTGCVGTPIPGWVEDMRPSVEARTVALAGAVAERITGFPMDARADADAFVLRAASDLGGPPLGLARTFIGFDAERVYTCFATCAGRRAEKEGGGVGCEAAIAKARLEGSAAPPSPGLALRGVTWAVHHPRPTALGGALVVVTAGVLAVASRRRPRSTLGRP
jgi:hypothetical protein